MFEVFVGVATIASAIAAVMMAVLALADRLKKRRPEQEQPK
jgi:hypothetical protein